MRGNGFQQRPDLFRQQPQLNSRHCGRRHLLPLDRPEWLYIQPAEPDHYQCQHTRIRYLYTDGDHQQRYLYCYHNSRGESNTGHADSQQ